jgi:hypothetical protein
MRGEISSASSLSILGDMLSGSCALYGLRFFSSFIIPFVVILNGFIVAENYRPISLTSVCSKILEHIIARNIMQHAE